MFRYKIIKIVQTGQINEDAIMRSLTVEVVKRFIGPSLIDTTEFGLYCGDELS